MHSVALLVSEQELKDKYKTDQSIFRAYWLNAPTESQKRNMYWRPYKRQWKYLKKHRAIAPQQIQIHYETMTVKSSWLFNFIYLLILFVKPKDSQKSELNPRAKSPDGEKTRKGVLVLDVGGKPQIIIPGKTHAIIGRDWKPNTHSAPLGFRTGSYRSERWGKIPICQPDWPRLWKLVLCTRRAAKQLLALPVKKKLYWIIRSNLPSSLNPQLLSSPDDEFWSG